MSTTRHKSMLTYRYRIKDATSGKHLLRMAWAVNTVWNYCNEISLYALKRDHRWLSAYDLINLCAGTSAELGISSETVNNSRQPYGCDVSLPTGAVAPRASGHIDGCPLCRSTT